MAHVRAHYGKIEVRFKIQGQRFVTTIPLTPTQTNIKATQARIGPFEARLKTGEAWATVRADLREEPQTASVRVKVFVPVLTLGHYAQHYLDHVDVERPTLMGYQSLYNKYWRLFDDRKIDELAKSELVTHLSESKVGWKTRRNAVGVLRGIFKIAKDDGAVREAPTDRWDIKRGQDKSPDPYTAEERDALLAAFWEAGQISGADLIAWRYFLFGFYSGMRTGELLGLEWKHLSKPWAHVCQERVRRRIEQRTKTKYDRRVTLPERVWSMLDASPTRFQSSFVFLTPEGRAFRDADWLMEKWKRAHQVSQVRRRTGPYPWRHTYISIGLQRGVPPILMAAQTGHDMNTMSRRYTKYIGKQSETTRAIEKAFA